MQKFARIAVKYQESLGLVFHIHPVFIEILYDAALRVCWCDELECISAVDAASRLGTAGDVYL